MHEPSPYHAPPDQGDTVQFCQRLAEIFQHLREDHRLTLDDVSKRSGISTSLICQLERGHAKLTVPTAHSLAAAYGVPLSELVEAAEPTASLTIIRSSDQKRLWDDIRGSYATRTTSPRLDAHIRGVRFHLVAGSRWQPVRPPSSRWITVIVESGVLQCQADDEVWGLEAHDVGLIDTRTTLELWSAGEQPACGHLIFACYQSA